MQLSPDEQIIDDDFNAKIKAAERELRYVMWRVVECDEKDEKPLLIELREKARISSNIKDQQTKWHANRKAEAVRRQEEEVAAHLARLPELNEPTEEMVAKHGERGLRKMLDNQRKTSLLHKLRHLTCEEIEALMTVDSAQAEVAKAQIKLAAYEKLAIEGKKNRLVNLALSNEDLRVAMETKDARIINNQRRSGGGVVRIESKDGT